MKIDIDKLTEKELIDLNHKIVERLKFLEQMRRHSAMLSFSIGEKVAFYQTGNNMKFGVVTKYNKKTVSVVTEDGGRWNVSPGILSKVKDAKQKNDAPKNVIELGKLK